MDRLVRGRYRWMHTHAHRQAHRQADKQTDKQPDKQTNRQTNKQTLTNSCCNGTHRGPDANCSSSLVFPSSRFFHCLFSFPHPFTLCRHVCTWAGFLDRYDPHHICNHSDESGRYDFQSQPSVCEWNLNRLAEDMAPLADKDALDAIRKE